MYPTAYQGHYDAFRARRSVQGVLVSPEEVRARMAALDSGWSSLAADSVKVTDPNAKAILSAFSSDLSAWKIFLQKNADVFWTAGSVNDELDDWQGRLSAWQGKLAPFVAISGVPVSPPSKAPLFDLGTPAAIGVGAAVVLALVLALRR